MVNVGKYGNIPCMDGSRYVTTTVWSSPLSRVGVFLDGLVYPFIKSQNPNHGLLSKPGGLSPVHYDQYVRCAK